MRYPASQITLGGNAPVTFRYSKEDVEFFKRQPRSESTHDAIRVKTVNLCQRGKHLTEKRGKG